MGTDLNDKESAPRLYRYIQRAQFEAPVWALGQVIISEKTVAGGHGVAGADYAEEPGDSGGYLPRNLISGWPLEAR
jgi:hypothetical protein